LFIIITDIFQIFRLVDSIFTKAIFSKKKNSKN